MCNKFKGQGGLLSEDNFMPYMLLKFYRHSIQKGMFLVQNVSVLQCSERNISSKQRQKTLFSFVYIFKSLIWKSFYSFHILIGLSIVHMNLSVFKCLRYEMNNSSIAMAFKLNREVYSWLLNPCALKVTISSSPRW